MDNIKYILFDIDGVIIRPPEYYSQILARTGYPYTVNALNKFYGHIDDWRCLVGEADPLATIKPYLQLMNWENGPEAFFDEQYRYETKYVDYDLLNQIAQLRNRGYQCHLATDQNSHRWNFLLNKMDLTKLFDGHFVSALIKHRKIENEFWHFVIEFIGNNDSTISPPQILFIDDQPANIKTASQNEINTYLVDSPAKMDQLKVMLAVYINRNKSNI